MMIFKEIDSIEKAKYFLTAINDTSFKDKTFNNYIENQLAGDFAVEIATIISSLINQLTAMEEKYKENP